MAEPQLSIADFSAAIKQRIPTLTGVPDDVLTRKILDRRPELITRLTRAPQPPGPPSTPEQPFSDRVIQRLSDNASSAARIPSDVISEARRRFDTRRGQASAPLNAAYSAFEGLYHKGIAPLAVGAYSVSTPGLIGRVASKDDPAAIAADMSTSMLPGGDELGRATHTAVDPTAAGPLRGAMTRAAATMDHLDAVAKDIPVDWQPTYEWARKALELEKYGYKAPPPLKAFVDLIDSRRRGGANAIPGQPESFLDTAGTIQPLTYQDARNFEASLGAKTDWDDPGGKMNALQKKARESLGRDTATALRPHGLDVPYLRAKADFTKAYGAKATWGPFGYFGGKLAGYGAGAFTGHPLITGYVGGKAGAGAAGSIVDSVVNAGRKPTAAPATPEWPAAYRNSPRTLSSTGGGGANYTAADLAALKQRMGL